MTSDEHRELKRLIETHQADTKAGFAEGRAEMATGLAAVRGEMATGLDLKVTWLQEQVTSL